MEKKKKADSIMNFNPLALLGGGDDSEEKKDEGDEKENRFV